MLFAKVILPLALPDTYTYRIPEDLEEVVEPGSAVEVQFGRSKLYTAIVEQLTEEKPKGFEPKDILSLQSDEPVIGIHHLKFWRWIAEYYLCTLGEVFLAAVPAPFRLGSETRIVFNDNYGDDFSELEDKEYLIAEALTVQRELSVREIQQILQRKTIQSILRGMIRKGVISIYEDMKTGFKPRIRKFIELSPALRDDEEALKEEFDRVEKRAPRQLDLLLAYLQLARVDEEELEDAVRVYKKPLLAKSGASHAALKALIKRGVFVEREEEISRLSSGHSEGDLPVLSEHQDEAYRKLKEQLEERTAALLFGVTSSGKTALYSHLMEETAQQGRQCLFLVPEIALTAQLTTRLRRIFGDRLGIYHSRFSANERVEIWRKVARGEYDFIVGPRSALFLPFKDLGLIIVDEEHDSSYKQSDPAPRYNARDAAVWLARSWEGKVILGTATPSMESYTNALHGKYGLVHLRERFAGHELPAVSVIDLKTQARKKLLQGHLSNELSERMEAALDRQEQIILFQNRRGYAPTVRCESCGWVPQCKNCDVSLTYHKYFDQLRCHLCGYRQKNLSTCPACASPRLLYQGFGTEQIEDELALRFPNARVARMDLDTTSGKYGHERLVNEFENREIDILVGTRMVTKGLDFAGVSIVGILSADQLLWFPDFRAAEQAYQLMAQVAGRAGRAGHGEVLIQTWDPRHPVIGYVMNGDYEGFYQQELNQRRQFAYPPFTRLIRIRLSHKDASTANAASKAYVNHIRSALGKRVQGPAQPPVGRIRGRYHFDVLVKLEKTAAVMTQTRSILRGGIEALYKVDEWKAVRVVIDGDPV